VRKYQPFVVAVTGSVGKTSSKDAIYSVLKDGGLHVRKSEKSLNSEIGLPLTILGVPNAWHNPWQWLKNIFVGLGLLFTRSDYPKYLVLEIGADHPRDIRKVVKWLHPDISVITKVSRTPVHVEFFSSPEEVFEEKAAMATAVKPGGVLVLFGDDEKVASLAERVKGGNVQVITYGLSDGAIIRGQNYQINFGGSNQSENNFVLGSPLAGQRSTDDKVVLAPVSGFSFKVKIDNQEISVQVKNVIGRTYQYPLLAAAAVGKARGIAPEMIAKSLSSYKPPAGRMNILSGMNGSTLIDDTYNSSPDAALAALQALGDFAGMNMTKHDPETRNPQRIAVLGDMMELGKFAPDEHRKVGKETPKYVTMLVTVGPRSLLTAEEARKNGLSASAVHSFNTATEAANFLLPKIKAGDIILVKGSQSMRLERLVKSLMAEPERSAELLVRQDKEWLQKS